ncbi:MAG: TIGR03013 family XrtA/PEP-CTERM system glycosyltransferase [Nitrospirota bacterium]
MKKIFDRILTANNIIFVTIEGILIFLSVLLSVALRLLFDRVISYDLIFHKAFVIMGVYYLSFYYNDLYLFRPIVSRKELFYKITKAIIVANLILFVIYYFYPPVTIGRGMFFINLILCSIFLIIWRLFSDYIIERTIFKERVLVVGAGQLAKRIKDEVETREELGIDIVGYIGSSVENIGINELELKVIGRYNDLEEIAKKEKIERIIVAMPERRGMVPMETLLKCKIQGIVVEDGISFYEKILLKIPIEGLNPGWLIFSDGFNRVAIMKIIKRGIDITISMIGLILSLPIFIFLPILIRLDSKGPVFLKQKRLGENGNEFTILKFRSMIEDAEKVLGPTWSPDNDDRITRVGRVIRKVRIDEIPQLFNVLKGDMSFVGPRPERPHFVSQLINIPYYHLRHSVKPGLTGWAQVKYQYGSTEEDAVEKLQYDIFYIKNMSIIFDFLIIFETVKVVLLGKGAR